MSDRAKVMSNIVYAEGGTTIKAGTEALEDELELLIGYINACQKLQGGTTAPSSPATGELWVDTSGTYPVLKRYNGSTWKQVLPNLGSASSDVTLDADGVATIAALAVETGMIAADAVDGTKLADDAVNSEHIADGAVDPVHLATQAAYTTLANNTSGSASPTAVTRAALREMLGILLATLGADFPKTNDTLADVTGLSLSLEAGQVYNFEALLFLEDATPGFAKFALSGTATVTAMRYRVEANHLDGSVDSASVQTALDQAISTTTETNHVVSIRGVITVNAAGTLKVQFAQATTDATASKVLQGSWLRATKVL